MYMLHNMILIKRCSQFQSSLKFGKFVFLYSAFGIFGSTTEYNQQDIGKVVQCKKCMWNLCFQYKSIEEKPVKIDKWDNAALKNALDDGAKKVSTGSSLLTV